MSVTSPFETRRSAATELLADRHLIWHKSAPQAVRSATGWSDESDGWQAWQKHLKDRKRPRSLERLLAARVSPLCWGLPADADSPRLGDETRSLIAKLPHAGSKKRKQSADVAAEATAWLAEIDDGSATVELGLESLAWAYALPQLADALPAECWWELLGRLLELTTASGGAAAIQGTVGDPWAWQMQLLAAELPLALAYTFPEIKVCRELAATGSAAIAAGMAELLDGQGLLRFSNFARLRPLVACWTRSRAMADELKAARWKKTARKQYASLVRQALRVTRRDGSQVFSRQEVDAAVQQEFWAAAVHLADNAKTTRAAAEMLRSDAGKRFKSRAGARGRSLPSPATHSERSAFGLLRTDWSAGSNRLAVGYSGRHIASEFSCGPDIIWSGHCQPQIRFQGDVLQPTGDWEEVCWLSDKDVDYLEVDIALGPNVRLERHMMLAREDNFLFWADAILANEPGDIDYRLALPLSDETRFEPAQETREGFLVGSKRRGLVLPLALPEWRVDPRGGSCESADDGLVLRQSATNARGMFVPMFVDLNRDRFGRQMTWRQLTVAENRQNQPADLAVGYRVQIGSEQWLMYRSLTPAVGRTLLSHHLLTQFLVGRFTPKGTVQVLVEIE